MCGVARGWHMDNHLHCESSMQALIAPRMRQREVSAILKKGSREQIVSLQLVVAGTGLQLLGSCMLVR